MTRRRQRGRGIISGILAQIGLGHKKHKIKRKTKNRGFPSTKKRKQRGGDLWMAMSHPYASWGRH